ncbi:hypothetical protein HDU87_004481 [Geranomyces variabilis]|uniref:SDE2-like domain-containing protein n=1 Tax=Geranomyces variabilis TaxID=109894 RepID=A0AAD5XMH9_9FUNG|nr:hypothetical protein HDU87_004481 [Geranomyces variabilis]
MASQKTTNFDSCRDLAGRRLKTVNDARALADYLEHEPARKRKRQEAKVEKLEKLAAANDGSSSGVRKARFHDPEFEDAHREVMEDVVGAVGRALELQKDAEKNGNGKGKESVVRAITKAAIGSSPAKAKAAPTVGADLSAWDALSDPESEEDDDDDEESGSDGEEVWQEEKAGEGREAEDEHAASVGSSSSGSEVHAAEVVEAAKKTLDKDVEASNKTVKTPKKKAKK